MIDVAIDWARHDRFPHVATANPQDVLDFIAGIGGSPFIISDSVSADLTRGYGRDPRFQPGAIECDAQPGVGDKEFYLTTWYPVAGATQMNIWWHATLRDFGAVLLTPRSALRREVYPEFQTLDEMADILVALGYPRDITANTLALYYKVSSAQIPAAWHVPIARFEPEVLLRYVADFVQQVPAYTTWQRIEAIWRQMPIPMLADYAHRHVPWDYVRALHAPKADG